MTSKGMDMLSLAVRGRGQFCTVIRQDDEGYNIYINPHDLPGGFPTEFEVGFAADKHGMVMTAGETSYIDEWLVEQRPANGHCFSIDLCQTHKLIAEAEKLIGRKIVMPWEKKDMSFDEFMASDETFEL